MTSSRRPATGGDSSRRSAVRKCCPVCGGCGSQLGMWTHLAEDHGWSRDAIRAAIGAHPYAARDVSAGDD